MVRFLKKLVAGSRKSGQRWRTLPPARSHCRLLERCATKVSSVGQIPVGVAQRMFGAAASGWDRKISRRLRCLMIGCLQRMLGGDTNVIDGIGYWRPCFSVSCTRSRNAIDKHGSHRRISDAKTLIQLVQYINMEHVFGTFNRSYIDKLVQSKILTALSPFNAFALFTSTPHC